MKRRNSIFFLCILCVAMLLSGCTQPIPLTEAERDAVAEYVAYLLLKYDKDYESSLVETITVTDNPSMVEEEFTVIGETKKPEENDTSKDTSSEKNSQEGSEAADKEEREASDLSNLFTEQGIRITYAGYQEYASYPEEGDFFSLVAPNGKKLVVIRFDVQNSSGKKQSFKLSEEEVNCRLSLDEKTSIRPTLTLLENDLQYLNIVLEPKEKTEAVVVFTVDKKAKLNGAKLLVYTETKTAAEELK